MAKWLNLLEMNGRMVIKIEYKLIRQHDTIVYSVLGGRATTHNVTQWAHKYHGRYFFDSPKTDDEAEGEEGTNCQTTSHKLLHVSIIVHRSCLETEVVCNFACKKIVIESHVYLIAFFGGELFLRTECC